MATATFSITNSTLDDNNLFKTYFVCEIAGASPYQDCQMLLSYYSPSAQGDVSLDMVYGTADGEGNVVLTYHLDGNRDVGGETLASIIFPSNSSTTSINCAASNSAGIIGFERFTLTLDAPPIFSDVTISSNRGDGVYVQGMTRIDVSAKIEPRFGSSIESAALYLTDSVGGSVHLGMAYSTAQNKWFGYVNVTYAIHSGNALLSIQATSGRGTYNNNIAEIIIKEHAYPSITIDCFRCDSNGDRDMNGDHISVTAYANSVPVELGITVLRGRIYPYPGPEEPVVWTNLTNGVPTLFEEASLSPDGTITTDEVISPDKGYRVAVQTSDGHYSSSKHIDIPPVNRIINVKEGGTGIAFGKLATEDELVDTEWGVRATAFRCRQKTKTSQAGMTFHTLDGTRNGQIEMNIYTTGDNVSLYHYNFREYSLDTTTGLPLATYETFRMPAPTFDRTDNGTYDIITTKNLTDIPDASATARGLVSTGAQTFAGNKTLQGIVYIGTGSEGVERNVTVRGDAGNIILYSHGTSTGKRGIWLPAHGTGGNVSALTVDENNVIYQYGNWSGETIPISKGGTGQTGQTAQQSYTPTVKIGTTTPTVSSRSAYYKSWGLMKLIGGRFNLTTTGTGSLIISLPTGFTVPTLSIQPMGILIAPDQKVYHIRVTADGLSAMNNGGSSVAWATGYYCFWAVVMGN